MSSPWEDCKWTKSRYFSFIRSCLRRAWSRYPVKYQALQDARKPYDGEDKRTKWLYQCNICKDWYKTKEVEVDHMIPAGSLKDYKDLAGFVERLFCSKKDLQVLCSGGENSCHAKKTREEREMNKEEWRDIEEIKGYQVSSKGRVRSMDREQASEKGRRVLKGKVLTPAPYRGGYLHLALGRDNVNKKVHRLVAEAFIPNPDNKPYINHKNMNVTDNNVANLEWCTAKENVDHAIENRGIFYVGKEIRGWGDNSEFLFTSSTEAEKYGFNASAIRNCINGRAKTHKGLQWEQLTKQQREEAKE